MTPEQSEKHPLRLFRINAGSCNGCDVELTATAALSRFALERQGFLLTEDPTLAQIVLITGPLTARVKEQVIALHAQIPEPKVTVAVGICPVSGGVFRESYAVEGPVDRHLPVQVNVPGCPPRPQAIVEGISAAARLFRGAEGAPAEAPEPSLPSATAPAREAGGAPVSIRGKLAHDPEACAGCRMCQHVCAGGAITFAESCEGLHFVLDHNACAFCGMCAEFCKTGALTQSGDWQTAHYQEEKGSFAESSSIPFRPCAVCGELLVPVPVELILLAFRGVNRELTRLQNLCPECRQREALLGVRR